MGDGETRGTTTTRAQPRVSQCPLTTDGCCRTGRPRYTSKPGSLARTIQRRAIYICEPIPDIYASCTRVAILHNRRDAAVHEVKTIPWKIGFTVPRFKQRVPRFCATKPRLATTPRYVL